MMDTPRRQKQEKAGGSKKRHSKNKEPDGKEFTGLMVQ